MTKTFKMVGKKLQVTVDEANDVYIPISQQDRENIGTFTQLTVQTISPDKIKVLKKFLKDNFDATTKQLKDLTIQYEPIKDLEDIGEDIMKQCRAAIQKGSKPFKESMKVLNKRISDLDRKNTLKAQIDYIDKQLVVIKEDYTKLLKTIK